ncbi:hypothetical protein LJC68_10095 [Bacteroidales bacterium OttesenSCG-928-B11]|nr:hypothetical protein [Bacteroidales bacterium OttesenSCG-928-E04]MDL2313211.1 hypothetical protein [Bacteroidales bacterium OttesenSCG-928-B11]MDL2325480.1 hypothetical protein [Bacteroidales bacterium OttesenSCG-928-A14]
MKSFFKNFSFGLNLIIFVMLTLISCENPIEPTPESEPDCRDKYVGEYEFTTIHGIAYCGEDNPMGIPIYDTIIYVGKIEKYDTDRLKITYTSNAIEPSYGNDINPATIHGIIYPVVDKSGTLTYPEFRNDRLCKFNGSFSDNEISVNYWRTHWQWGYETQEIYGIIK